MIPGAESAEASQLLIVDDDPELLQFLLEELQLQGFACSTAANGHEALLKLDQQRFDLVLLDWTLPDYDGLEVCRRMRSTGIHTPVLMITARDDMEERVSALDSGVDDYLTKPFNLKELHARVRAQLRRGGYGSQAQTTEESLQLGDLSIDRLKRKVSRGDQEIALSQREFELLCFLVRGADAVHPRQEILEAVWGAPFIGDPNTLDVYMGYLRRKLEKPGLPVLLHTRRGVGFMARVGQPKA